MPIEIEKFKAAQQDLSERILALLGKEPRSAYTIYEIISVLENMDSPAAAALAVSFERAVAKTNQLLDRYDQAVRQLLDAKKIERAQVQAVDYYARSDS